MAFEFATATRIIFGTGKSREMGTLARSLGSRALLVSGLSGDLTDPLADMLEKEGIHPRIFPISKEPTICCP
jgi:alcohol dehydrogenase class IV